MGAAAGAAGSGWHNCRATAGGAGVGGLAGHPPISYFLWHATRPMLYGTVFMGTIRSAMLEF